MTDCNENDAIPMDGSAVHYEEEQHSIIPAGTYNFRILRTKTENVSASDAMPKHVNVKWFMLIEDDDGNEVGKAWDNLRMYKKWLWKYAQLAKCLGYTAKDSDSITFDWGRFESANGVIQVDVAEWKRRDGTKEPQNKFKYLPAENRPAIDKDDLPGEAEF